MLYLIAQFQKIFTGEPPQTPLKFWIEYIFFLKIKVDYFLVLSFFSISTNFEEIYSIAPFFNELKSSIPTFLLWDLDAPPPPTPGGVENVKNQENSEKIRGPPGDP